MKTTRPFFSTWYLILIIIGGPLLTPKYSTAIAAEADLLCEIPAGVAGIKQPLKSLNGQWEFCRETNQSNWEDAALVWHPITVPGEPAMQGFPIQHDVWYAYRKNLNISQEFLSKEIILRFNGVYSHAKVWLNGKFVREHQGGFTAWECSLTELLRPGDTNHLVVAFCDPIDDISYASGYAKHPIGGILRNVELIILPATFIADLDAETTFDESYTDASLVTKIRLNKKAENAAVRLSLFSPAGEKITLNNFEADFGDNQTAVLENPAQAPAKWDAEHPNLYELTAELVVDEQVQMSVRRKIGFRQVQVMGNQLLVNGHPIKLGGACRHDMHPLLGRSTSDEYDLKDVLLAKEANFNFIRTSHYPPSRAFLEYCDMYGLYVEEETAVCFVGTWRSDVYKPYGNSQDDTAYTARYLGQLAEMIERDRNHPSVIIWSIGNENKYGANFRREFDYVKKVDPSRPVMFSYPGYGSDDKIYDILSVHYPTFEGRSEPYGFKIENFAYPGIPVLHDEWAHVACYNINTLKTDPNVRDFWGQSLDKMWANCYAAEGALGGAIWGMIDETFMLPDTCVGYGQWGIVDTWRRPKPEFWNTKKAYSPVRLAEVNPADFKPGKEVGINVQNRFDHTNMKEVKIVCNGRAIVVPDIPPHQSGMLTIPGSLAGAGKSLDVSFYQNEMLIDRYNFQPLTIITSGSEKTKPPATIKVAETDAEVSVSAGAFAVNFSKKTGLISSAFSKGEKIISGGPLVTLIARDSIDVEAKVPVELAGVWQLESFQWQKTISSFAATTSGYAGSLPVTFTTSVNPAGEIQIDYTVENSAAVCREAGIYFLLTNTLDKSSWDRNAYWSYYPEGHLGRPRGVALKTSPHAANEKYRQTPPGVWENDSKDFYLFGTTGKRSGWLATPNDFLAAKMQVYRFALFNSLSQNGILALSGGKLSCRTEVAPDGSLKLLLLDVLGYPDLDWGNFEGDGQIANPHQSQVRIKLVQGDILAH